MSHHSPLPPPAGDAPDRALDSPAADAKLGLALDLAVSASGVLDAAGAGNVRITIRDFTYSVKHARKKGERAVLLNGVSSFMNPAEMSALMGPSGSGKTTLLDLLAGRKTTGEQEGEILFGGLKPTQQYLRRYTGYVEQFDTLLHILTVTEMLMYTAELKRPLSEPLSSKRQAVQELLGQLGLDVCKNTLIGSSAKRGISGGQLKRTNIGIALITSPKVLFLDEPTTGLDSYTANEVMTVVRSLTRLGTTVCATIHSPTSYCFNIFDRVTILVRGRLVYFGARADAVDFFTSFPGIKEYSPGYNDAEYLTDVVTEADRFGRGGELADQYQQSDLHSNNLKQLSGFLNEKNNVSEETLKELQVRRSTVTPWWWGMWVFIKYRTKKNYQDPSFLAPRVFDKLMISILVMTLYLGIGNDISPDNIINIAAVLFMWAGTTAFAAAAYMPSLFLERGLFVRERSDGLYLVVTYLTAKLFDELLINFVAALPISAFVFYGVRLQGNFGLFYISYSVGLAAGIALAYFIASAAPGMDAANAILPIYAVTLLFFAGFLIKTSDMPPWWKWYSYLCFSRYSWGANMINQFENNDIVYLEGQTVLQYYQLDGQSKWAYTGYTALFFLFFYITTWLTLQFKRYNLR